MESIGGVGRSERVPRYVPFTEAEQALIRQARYIIGRPAPAVLGGGYTEPSLSSISLGSGGVTSPTPLPRSLPRLQPGFRECTTCATKCPNSEWNKHIAGRRHRAMMACRYAPPRVRCDVCDVSVSLDEWREHARTCGGRSPHRQPRARVRCILCALDVPIVAWKSHVASRSHEQNLDRAQSQQQYCAQCDVYVLEVLWDCHVHIPKLQS